MKLLSTQQIQEWDQYTLKKEGIHSLALMERAANACYLQLLCSDEFKKQADTRSEIAIYCGQGNNGGDGLVIARKLHENGYAVKVFLLKLKEKGSEDFEANREKVLQLSIPIFEVQSDSDLANLGSSTLILDCLFGSGLNKPLSGLAANLVSKLNQQEGLKIAIDIPSGLFGDIEKAIKFPESMVFKAHYTLSLQLPKTSMLFKETGEACGELLLLDIGLNREYEEQVISDWRWLDAKQFAKTRTSKFALKWQKGHALIVGGSYGKMGAMLLSSKAALRAGCGLLSVYVPAVAYRIFQTAFPEAMVQTDLEHTEIRTFPDVSRFDAIGLGPGLGMHAATRLAFKHWIARIQKPIVIDADALNLCADLRKENPDFEFPKEAILTPHEREFDRLFGICETAFHRLQVAVEKAKAYKVIIVMKGAYTKIVLPDGRVFFNSSGNSMLGTAGSGDVLTGIIASFLAQGLSAEEAAKRGVFIHGLLASQLHAMGVKNLIASDLIEQLRFQDKDFNCCV